MKKPTGLLDNPPKSGGDDLTLISGIGAGLHKRLNDFGVYYFSQIAKWGTVEIAFVDDQLNFRGRILRDKWVEQAQNLANPAPKSPQDTSQDHPPPAARTRLIPLHNIRGLRMLADWGRHASFKDFDVAKAMSDTGIKGAVGAVAGAAILPAVVGAGGVFVLGGLAVGMWAGTRPAPNKDE